MSIGNLIAAGFAIIVLLALVITWLITVGGKHRK